VIKIKRARFLHALVFRPMEKEVALTWWDKGQRIGMSSPRIGGFAYKQEPGG